MACLSAILSLMYGNVFAYDDDFDETKTLVESEESYEEADRRTNDIESINQKVKTMTYDNGTENINHELANKLLNCKSFFCNAYHSWKKGFYRKQKQNFKAILSKRNELRLDSRGRNT